MAAVDHDTLEAPSMVITLGRATAQVLARSHYLLEEFLLKTTRAHHIAALEQLHRSPLEIMVVNHPLLSLQQVR